MTGIILVILTAVPKGITALRAIGAAIHDLLDAAEERSFLAGCTAMCQAILINNPTLSPDDARRWCADAIYYYGINMGHPVDRKMLTQLGVVFTTEEEVPPQ